MKRFKNFLKTTIIGGLVVVLPVVVTILFIKWAVEVIKGIIHPLTQIVEKSVKVNQFVAEFIVIVLFVLICFVIGLVVKTALGRFLYRFFEKRILKIAPGYSLFKETIKQFLGQERAPFSQVALVRVFENSTLMTGFVTDEHPDGKYTVFVPSGLNPTSGVIYHLEKEYVHLVDTTVEETLRSIISCGAGSKDIIVQTKKNQLEEKNDRKK